MGVGKLCQFLGTMKRKHYRLAESCKAVIITSVLVFRLANVVRKPNSIKLPISASMADDDDNPNILFISISSFCCNPYLISAVLSLHDDKPHPL